MTEDAQDLFDEMLDYLSWANMCDVDRKRSGSVLYDAWWSVEGHINRLHEKRDRRSIKGALKTWVKKGFLLVQVFVEWGEWMTCYHLTDAGDAHYKEQLALVGRTKVMGAIEIA